MMGLDDLLKAIHRKWETDRKELLEKGEKVVGILSKPQKARHAPQEDLPDRAVRQFERTYDRKWGGFGSAPKFPAPHNLIFLMEEYRHFGKTGCLEMARHTIMSMYRGGLFDHIGFGFSRYSTDNRFLVPHFEKMLYDNALMTLCCVKAHTLTQGDTLLLEIARRTARYILREMTSPDGGFYSAQDADSEGEEGKYYLFTPEEIETVLGSDDAQAFNRAFGITGRGNFEGKNIPSLLSSDPDDSAFDGMREKVYRYRRERHALHLDDKIVTSWNGLMIAALCALYRVTGDRQYIAAAEKANGYVMTQLREGDTLYAGSAAGMRGVKGFLDDYAAMCLAQLALYGATYAQEYLGAAQRLFGKAVTDFADPDFGGFWFYSRDSEKLILRPKETYDGAMPSGNSLMAWNLVRLEQLTGNEAYGVEARRQLDFLKREASDYPAGYTAFLSALLEHEDPSVKITAVIGNEGDIEQLPFRAPLEAAVTVLRRPTKQFPLKDGKTTYYICSRFRCLAAANDLTALSEPAMPV